jgi:predicted anti-sigma-YlaC factor YlaD
LTNTADQYSSIGAAKTVSNYAGSSLIREANAVEISCILFGVTILGNALWQKQSQRIAITLTLIFAAAIADCRRLSGMAVVATREEEGVSKQKIKRTSLFLLYVLISHTALLFLLPFFSSF